MRLRAFGSQLRAILETCRSLFLKQASFLCFFGYFFGVLKKLAKITPFGVCSSRRELNFHFCSRTPKGLQNGSQNGAFGEPRSSLYSFAFAHVAKIYLQKSFIFFDMISEHLSDALAQGVG